MSRSLFLASLTIASLFVHAIAFAQEPSEPVPPPPPPRCADGMVPEATGHCCWPGQTWSEDRTSCTGAPQCSAGWVGEGNRCVREAPAAPPPPPSPEPQRKVETSETPAAPRSVDEPPATRTRANRGLLIGGAVTLGVSYLLTTMVTGVLVAVGAAQQANDGITCMDGVGWGFLPVIGPAIAASSYPNELRFRRDPVNGQPPLYSVDCAIGASAMRIFGTTMTIVQGSGAAMLGLSFAIRQPVKEKREAIAPRPRAMILPGAPGTPLGLSVSFVEF